MSVLKFKGFVRNGRIEVDRPIDLPDGSPVTITGDDDDRPRTPEEIAANLAAMDRIEPFDMTDEERESIEAWEKKVNEYSKMKSEKRIEGLFP
jgi:hypothetical protein